MKLFLISQNQQTGYDTFSAAVVAAPDAKTAKGISPNGHWESWQTSWASSPKYVKAKYIGETKHKQGMILASFHAG